MTIQKEFKGMPEPDECGKIAQEYLDVLKDIEKCQARKRDKSEELMQAMRKAKRFSLKVEGKTILLQHVEEADVIKVKK